MALLNLKAFLKQCEKRLVYYDHLDYHLFTNGVIMYGIAKGTERPDMYLEEYENDFNHKISILESKIILYEKERKAIIRHLKEGNIELLKSYFGIEK